MNSVEIKLHAATNISFKPSDILGSIPPEKIDPNACSDIIRAFFISIKTSNVACLIVSQLSITNFDIIA